jgi:hypothetical protein
MKKYFNEIFTGISCILGVVAYLLFLGPVFGSCTTSLSVGGYGGSGKVDGFKSDSFYAYLGSNSAYKGLGISILIFISLAVAIALFAIIYKLACKKENKFFNYGICLFFAVAGILTFFLGLAASGKASDNSIIAVSGSVTYSLGACAIINGIVLIIAAICGLVPAFNKSSK